MNKLSVIFWLRRSRPNKLGQFPIICRITVNGDRLDFATNEFVHPDKWEYKVIKGGKEKLINEQKVLGKGAEASATNDRLALIKVKIKNAFNKLDERDEILSAELVKELAEGKNLERKQTLMKAFDVVLSEMNDLVAKKFIVPETVERYQITKKNIVEFLKYSYGKNDIYLKDMNLRGRPEFSFPFDFEHWGKTVKNWGVNYAKKELKRTNKILISSLNKGWIDRNPFKTFSLQPKEGPPKFLTASQVSLLEISEIAEPGYSEIRDLFLFCCYTGLAFSEVKALSWNNVTQTMDQKEWVFIHRKKTINSSAKVCKIPLIEKAKDILNKYKSDPRCISNGVCMPVPSNPHYNRQLKTIQAMCNQYSITKDIGTVINVKLTTHVARHTCATILLDRGYSKEFVAEVLGHRDTKLVGSVYGDITTKRMSLEIENIERMKPNENNNQQKIK